MRERCYKDVSSFIRIVRVRDIQYRQNISCFAARKKFAGAWLNQLSFGPQELRWGESGHLGVNGLVGVVEERRVQYRRNI